MCMYNCINVLNRTGTATQKIHTVGDLDMVATPDCV